MSETISESLSSWMISTASESLAGEDGERDPSRERDRDFSGEGDGGFSGERDRDFSGERDVVPGDGVRSVIRYSI